MIPTTVALRVDLAFLVLSNHHWMQKVTKKRIKSENITPTLSMMVLGYSSADVNMLGLSRLHVAH